MVDIVDISCFTVEKGIPLEDWLVISRCVALAAAATTT